MSARFRVHDGFHLPTRQVWVIRGDIVEGELWAGMFAYFPLNEATGMSAPIRSVEFVDSAGGLSHVGLVLDCEDEIVRALWEGFSVPGEVLEVTAHDPAV